jgi:hypothetical protein
MKSFLTTLIVMTIGCVVCTPARAQEGHATQADTQSSSSVQTTTREREDDWHLAVSPYLWFAGTHGTVGARGHNVSMHASPSDLLSHFNFGLMGTAEARRKRFLLTGDLIWIRLSDSHPLPFLGLGAVSADVRVGQLVWTSKIGYRVIDNKKMKADANIGARYWHLGQKLSFNPSTLGFDFSGSQNWGDIVIGGHIQLPMGKKTSIDALGDVGGWGASAKLDYQFAALLSYKICPKASLVAGYRYLFVDYRPSNLSVFTVVTSGAVLGTTFRF